MTGMTITPMIRAQLKNEIRELLIMQAKIKKTISYGELCKIIISAKLKPDDSIIPEILGEISKGSHNAGNGLLSVVVTGKVKDLPGKGFFSMAMRLGYTIGNWEQFFKEQMDEVHKKYRDPSVLTM